MKIRNIVLRLGAIGLIAGFAYLYAIASTSDFNVRYGLVDYEQELWSEKMPIALIIIGISLAVVVIAKFVPIIINNIITERQAIEEMKQKQIAQRKLLREKRKADWSDYNEFIKNYEEGYRIDN